VLINLKVKHPKQSILIMPFKNFFYKRNAICGLALLMFAVSH